MTFPRVLAWGLFTVWAVWSFALQGALGGSGGVARWVPDLGLVFALSVLARLDAKDAPLCALFAALARSVFSVEPAVALLAGFAAFVAIALAVRTVVELSSPVWRALVAAALVFLFDAWLIAVHGIRGAQGSQAMDPIVIGAHDLLSPWPTALTSGLLALAIGPLLAYLPGLTPLRSRRW